MVTRSSLKASNVSRQNSMMQGQNELPSKAFYDQTCDQLMQQVANWDYPGNILSVLRKPSALSTHVLIQEGAKLKQRAASLSVSATSLSEPELSWEDREG